MGESCALCLRVFVKPGNLRRHLATDHPEITQQHYIEIKAALELSTEQHDNDNHQQDETIINEKQTDIPVFDSDEWLNAPNGANDAILFPISFPEIICTNLPANAQLSSVSSKFDPPEAKQVTYEHLRVNFPRAGEPLTEGCISGYNMEAKRLLERPYHPFKDAFDFTFARWFIEFQVTDASMGALTSLLYYTQNISTKARSKESMKALAHELEPKLGTRGWKSASVKFEDDDAPVAYYYRDPIELVEYILSQPAYRDHLIYAPVKEYQDGCRIYSELHTANWWWETQVCLPHLAF